MTLQIRRASDGDWPSIWRIISPVLGTGETYTLPPDTTEADARAYWTGAGVAFYVAERNGDMVGTYAIRANQPGQGAHVANAGYMVRPDGAGKGVGAAMGEHSLGEARTAGFRAWKTACAPW